MGEENFINAFNKVAENAQIQIANPQRSWSPGLKVGKTVFEIR